MFVSSEAKNQDACEYAYAIDFYKDHCGGDLSKTMSYLYQGCYIEGSNNYVQRKSVFLWDITFTYVQDMLNVSVVDSRFNGKITQIRINALDIYEMTNGGIDSFVIYVVIYDDKLVIDYTKFAQNP